MVVEMSCSGKDDLHDIRLDQPVLHDDPHNITCVNSSREVILRTWIDAAPDYVLSRGP